MRHPATRAERDAPANGFTLVEVVMALLVLEIAVVCLVGALLLASSTLTRAESLERAVAAVEGVLDSIAGRASAGADSTDILGATVHWVVDDSARARVRAVDAGQRVLVEVEAALGPW